MAEGVPHKLIDVQIQGGEKCRANLRVWAEKFPAATADAFLGDMQDTMVESQAECPFDYENQHLDGTPHLRDTAKAEIGIQTKDVIVVEGSYSTPYAVFVHEILGNHHLWPTKAKFLEDPANRRAPGMLGRVRQKLGAMFR